MQKIYFARRLLDVDVFVIVRDVGFSLLVVLSSSSSISSSPSSFNGWVDWVLFSETNQIEFCASTDRILIIPLLFFLLVDNSCMISRCLRILLRPEYETYVQVYIERSESTYVLSLFHVWDDRDRATRHSSRFLSGIAFQNMKYLLCKMSQMNTKIIDQIHEISMIYRSN